MPVPQGKITTTTVWQTPEAVQEPVQEVVEEVVVKPVAKKKVVKPE